MNKIDELIKLLQSNDVNIVYDTIIDIGKGHIYELQDYIKEFLDHEDTILRSAAIRVLAFYWQIDEFKNVAHRIYLDKLEDEDTRSVALMAWSIYYQQSKNKKILKIIYDILSNKNESALVRATAYTCILSISGLPKSEWVDDIDIEKIDDTINWDLVNKLVEKHE